REAGRAERTHARIEQIGFVTADRVEPLCHAIASYARKLARFGRAPRFVVMDSSASPATRDAYRRALRALARELGAPIAYAGQEEKHIFATALVRETGAPPEVVAFALCGYAAIGAPIGANRNALLLETA